jgi:arsenate reductase
MSTEKRRVLFLCGQNSARSQMAEAWLDVLGAGRYEPHSAGLDPAPVNPLAVAVMAERGIDISARQSKLVGDVLARAAAAGEGFDDVITVCAKAAEACPFIPGLRVTERWSFEDPGALAGTPEEQLETTRRVRDEIEAAVRAWVERARSREDEA